MVRVGLAFDVFFWDGLIEEALGRFVVNSLIDNVFLFFTQSIGNEIVVECVKITIGLAVSLGYRCDGKKPFARRL